MRSHQAFRNRAGGACAAAALVWGAIAFADPASARPSAGGCDSSHSVRKGTYSSLTISGSCALDAGTVKVTGDVRIESGAFLWADYAGSDLQVSGSLIVAAHAGVLLGCSPTTFICINDPTPSSPRSATHHSIGRRLMATGAGDVLVHSTSVGGDVNYVSGVRDTVFDLSEFGDNTVRGSVTITSNSSRWMSFFHNHIYGSVTYDNNTSTTAVGNEISGNRIDGDLHCQGNVPAPQVYRGIGGPNIVAGSRTGQCTTAALP